MAKRESKRLDENYFMKDEIVTKLMEVQHGTKTDLESFCLAETFDDFSFKATGKLKSLKEDVGQLVINR